MTALDASRRLLAIDTSTALAVVALGGSDGRLDGASCPDSARCSPPAASRSRTSAA